LISGGRQLRTKSVNLTPNSRELIKENINSIITLAKKLPLMKSSKKSRLSCGLIAILNKNPHLMRPFKLHNISRKSILHTSHKNRTNPCWLQDQKLRTKELKFGVFDPEANKWYQSIEASRSNLSRSSNVVRLYSSSWIRGRQDAAGIRRERWQRRLGGSRQRVVREIGVGPANWPLHTKMNYTEWALIMKIKLQARNLWEAIKPGDVTLQEDRMALDPITSAVTQEMLASLAVKATAAEAWEAVRSLRIGSEAFQNVRAQRLRMEFDLAALLPRSALSER
jgi:hypothetical protein